VAYRLLSFNALLGAGKIGAQLDWTGRSQREIRGTPVASEIGGKSNRAASPDFVLGRRLTGAIPQLRGSALKRPSSLHGSQIFRDL
jgi:hypothetical protein